MGATGSWHLACDLLARGGGGVVGGGGVIGLGLGLAKPDLAAMPSTRVLAALKAEHQANNARRAAALTAAHTAAARHVRALRLARRRHLARAVRAHFVALASCERAVRDALAVDQGCTWARPDTHGLLTSLLRDISLSLLDELPTPIKLKLQSSKYHPVIRARANDAQIQLRELQYAFDKSREASQIMNIIADPVRTELMDRFNDEEEGDEEVNDNDECVKIDEYKVQVQIHGNDDETVEIQKSMHSIINECNESKESKASKDGELVDNDVNLTENEDGAS